MALSDSKIRGAKPKEKRYQLSDIDGLYLDILVSGTKVWRYRFYLAGKDGRATIGEYPAWSLADARAARDDLEKLVKRGINPNEHKRAVAEQVAAQATFEAVAREWLDKYRARVSDNYAAVLLGRLESNVFPVLGSIPIADVSSADVLRVMRACEQRGAVTIALKCRGYISQVMCYAVSTLRAAYDVAAPVKGAVIAKPTQNATAHSTDTLIQLFERLPATLSRRQTVIALKMMMIVFTRTTELRAARWSEFDMDAAIWRIPVERLKTRKQRKMQGIGSHDIPLPRQFVALLDELRKITGWSEYLFQSSQSKSGYMGLSTINHCILELGFDVAFMTGHDFRATASTHLREMGYPRAFIEAQLAHSKGDQTDSAYDHAQYMTKRREMLQAWADHLEDCERIGLQRYHDKSGH